MRCMTDPLVLANLRRGTLEYCVLASLADGPLYGLDIARRLGRVPGLFESEGTLYPLLARLRRSGWVTTRLQESEAGAARRYYDLTAEGRLACESFRDVWAEFSRGVTSVLEGTSRA